MLPTVLAEKLRYDLYPFDPHDLDVIEAHQILARRAIAQCAPFHQNSSGRGIVICGGGQRYFPGAWVAINLLRQLGCKLPVQLWHFNGEIDSRMAELVKPLDVTCINANLWASQLARCPRILNGWELKPFAILHSAFTEVLFLDADNVPVANPEPLFEAAAYRATGAIFWPDENHLAASCRIWNICEVPYQDEPEVESGQALICKAHCWDALNLTMHYNEHSDFYYKHMYGDKETFHMAWRRLNQPYTMPEQGMERIDTTICQYDLEGNRLFQHRNMDKWKLDGSNRRLEDFQFEDECREALAQLRDQWDGQIADDARIRV